MMPRAENFREPGTIQRVDKYQILGRIGEGAFGEVRLGLDNDTGNQVALKYVKILSKKKLGIPKAVFREMESLRQLSSHFVIQLIDVYPVETALVLVLEYMASDLSEVILQAPQHLPRSHIKCIMLMLIEAIGHCHKSGIIHRDIKPSNILLSKNGQLKIGDFGLARLLEHPPNSAAAAAGHQSLSHQVATRCYRAPELLYASRHYDFAVDMWSCGVVLGELMLLSPLFPGTNDIDQMFKVFQIMGTPTPDNWPVSE